MFSKIYGLIGLLTVAQLPLQAQEVFTPQQVVYSTVDALRVRDRPALDGKPVGSLGKGDSLRVITLAGEAITVSGKTARWVEFDFDGRKGYVFAGFLSSDMPILAHTPAAWKKIQEKNSKYNAKRIKEAEEWAKANPDDQNCTPPSCYSTELFGWPEEYKKGCTQRKLAAIKKLMSTKGISAYEAVSEYGDGYCQGWQQWPMIEMNCGDTAGQKMPAFPLE